MYTSSYDYIYTKGANNAIPGFSYNMSLVYAKGIQYKHYFGNYERDHKDGEILLYC